MPRWQCDATSLIHDWSELDGFFQAFLELGGLEWLTTLTYPCANSCRACIYFSNPISGLLSCIGGLKGQSFIHQTVRLLPQAQSELILRSSILRNSVEDENAHEYIFIIKTLYVHLRDMGHQGAFPETASQCAKIMARGSQRERYWERTRLQFNAGSFENWCEEVMALIHDLNKVSISDNLVTGPSTVPLLNQRAF
ncbi:hypothetical protein CPB86DRAFT_783927 [Serendipita vermifera]|nr:hypothetical protein CPB86DRAFT_783927 [Serendipita vermifera]